MPTISDASPSSARIGRLEDEEDLKKEREEKGKKRRKVMEGKGATGGKSSGRHLVQTKIR